ncbi:DUF1524 domain-containing protein, partial [Synechococcus moorigangaii CMS01]|nr:DUF1524 domain-containing protein [Synechococcus moorigangaii CMS01]
VIKSRVSALSAFFFFLLIRRPPTSTQGYSSAASDVYKRQEHIYSKKRQEIEDGLKNVEVIESLGNKILLEGNINIRASDYRFEDKKKIYSGEKRRGKNQEPSKISEITQLIEYDKFEEKQIVDRNRKILDKFFEFLQQEELIARQ